MAALLVVICVYFTIGTILTGLAIIISQVTNWEPFTLLKTSDKVGILITSIFLWPRYVYELIKDIRRK